jgi:methylated-DNA-[protein]-cysteine S-methyltransferase
MSCYATVRTDIGVLALGFSQRGLSRVLLPSAHWTDLKPADLAAAGFKTETQAPPEIADLARGLQAHLAGDVQDFSKVALDTDGVSPFLLQVQRAARSIPPGQTRTYGELASSVGVPGAGRAAGRAMSTNRFPIIVPCHRVVARSGFGDYSAGSGVHTKLRLLWCEGYRGRTSNVSFDEREAIAHLQAADPHLADLIDRAGPFTMQATSPHPRGGVQPFSVLAGAIIAQQLSGRAAATIHGRVAALTDSARVDDAHAVLALPKAKLRQAGLSENKALSLLALARHATSGDLPSRAAMEKLSDEDIIARLTQVRGIGRWSAQMLLMLYLGRPDVLPVSDLGVQKGFAAVYRSRSLPSEKTLLRAARSWSPYATVASWYLWRAVELAAYAA